MNSEYFQNVWGHLFKMISTPPVEPMGPWPHTGYNITY